MMIQQFTNKIVSLLALIIIIAGLSVSLINCSSRVTTSEESDTTIDQANTIDRSGDQVSAVNQSNSDRVSDSEHTLASEKDSSVSDQSVSDQIEDALEDAAQSDALMASETGKAQNALPTKRETRAIWSWAGRKPISGEYKVFPRDIDELVEKVDAAHLNVILLVVTHDGSVYFEPSHTRFPDESERLVNQSVFSKYGYQDGLSYLLTIRDERRIDDDPFNDFEVQAWFQVNKGGDMTDKWPSQDKTEPYMLHALFPEFKLKYGDYYAKEDDRYVKHDTPVLHQPKFRAYIIDLVAGLVEDYDVDGIHLDYIRTGGICFNNEPLDYPGTEYDYPGCQEDYKTWTRETYGREYTLWEDTDGSREIQDGGSGRVAAWQERAVGLVVKGIHDEVKAIKPDVIISVASVRNDVSQKTNKQLRSGQVAWEWLDKGWIDAVFPTFYTPETESAIRRYETFSGAVQDEKRRSVILPGLITFDPKNSKDHWAGLVAEQVSAVLGQGTGQPPTQPAKGVALFLARRLSPEAIQALAEGPFREPALPYWGE